ncbi:MAG: class II aldolase/adducin family protein [Microbacterium sp.]
MAARISPEDVSSELIELTNHLGERERDLVILAEGNTSELLPGGSLVVKTSGSSMREAGIGDFVTVDVAGLVALLEDPATDQAALTAALTAQTADGSTVRASIETLIHVSVRAFGDVRFVAHTHPTSVVSLLASANAPHAFDEAVYSDEVVVLGESLFVPYAQPGIELGRVFHEHLRAHVEARGGLPSLILLGNHGIVAISDTAAGAEAISEMAVKSARVRIGAIQAGGIAGLNPEMTRKYFERDDMRERRASLSGS